jgi:hypothetical protein
MRLDLSSGERLVDPEGQAVEAALRSVGQGEEFAILVDDEQGGQHFLQVAKESEGFVVEYREGQRQFRSNPLPLETVIRVFQGYRKQQKSWKEGVCWRDITGEIDGKAGCRARAASVVALLGLGVWAAYRVLA